MSIGSRIAWRRRMLDMTQNDLAEQLGVTFQAVSSWERDEHAPETDKLMLIAKALGVKAAFLLGEEDMAVPDFTMNDRLFDEEHMYTFVKSAAGTLKLTETLRALPFARERHKDQTRKGKDKVPYISHPLTMTCHALAMGIKDDDALAAILLHDVVEDCGAAPEDLPVGPECRETVRLLSKDPSHEVDEEGYDTIYFAAIARHPQASLVKLLDRCHNLSVMASGMTRERMLAYAQHTRRWVLPLADGLRGMAPQYSNACFILKYHMQSVLHTAVRLLAGDQG